MYEVLHTAILYGLLLGLVALGLMVAFRLLSFPDLTIEGSYPFGAVIYTYAVLQGISSIFATLIAATIAGLVGLNTAFLHLRFKINPLLAGIIISTMLYSLNLRLLGRPNVGLFNLPVLVDSQEFITRICVVSGVVSLVAIGVLFFFHTQIGLRLRAVGLNKSFAASQGISTYYYTSLGLFITNMLAGLAGSLTAQLQKYTDVGMGFGITTHALAGLMLGESLIGNKTVTKQIIAPVIGSVVYQTIQGSALFLGLAPSDLKFLSGFILLIVLAFRKNKKLV